MTNQIDSDWNISICGLNCSKCRLYESDLCHGCRSNSNVHWSPDCVLTDCADEKGYTFCFQCHEFPCDKIEEFANDGLPHHLLTVKNLKRMKEIGLESWLAEQSKPMFCAGWIF